MKKNCGKEINPHSITFILPLFKIHQTEKICIGGKFSVATPNYKVVHSDRYNAKSLNHLPHQKNELEE